MKKNFYLATFVLLLILQLTLITACLISGVKETEKTSYDYAKALTALLLTSPVSLMIILSAVIVFSRYKDKKENEEIKKFRSINNS
ncbi:MAG: hypothetical protein IJ561_09210 [Ruminococcus sp.]|nr:hypothetical protein [Ruminococcus sp.]MBR1393998.1 hypothetical protein [Ruminococcus sp.]